MSSQHTVILPGGAAKVMQRTSAVGTCHAVMVLSLNAVVFNVVQAHLKLTAWRKDCCQRPAKRIASHHNTGRRRVSCRADMRWAQLPRVRRNHMGAAHEMVGRLGAAKDAMLSKIT